MGEPSPPESVDLTSARAGLSTAPHDPGAHLAAAACYLRLSRLAAARQEYWRAAALGGDRRAVADGLCLTALADGDGRAAADTARPLHQEGDSRFTLYLAAGLAVQGHSAAAARLAARLSAADGADVGSRYAQAVLASAAHDHGGAIRACLLAQQAGQDFTPALLLLASMYLCQGNLVAEEQCYRRLYACDPTNPAFVHKLARVLLDGGNAEAALELVEDAHNRDVRTPALLVLRAEALMAARRYEQARRILERLATTDRYRAIAAPLVCACWARQGRYEALLQYAAGLPDETIRTGKVPALLAEAFSALGLHSEALARFRAHLAANPGDLDAKTQYGIALARAGEPGECEAIIWELDSSPCDPLALLFLRAVHEFHEHGSGEALFRQYLEQEPEDERAMHMLARSLARDAKGNLTKEAYQLLSAALKRNPRYAPAWLALAEEAQRRGDRGRTTEVVSRALGLGCDRRSFEEAGLA